MPANSEGSFAEEDGGAIFSVLDDQSLRPHSQHFLRGTRKIGLSSQHFGFTVIDQQDIHQLQGFVQFAARTLNPKIHGVAAGKANLLHFAPDSGLQTGMDIGQK